MVIILSSCYKGVNFNQGKTHNEEKANREKIVLRHDAFVKKEMAKHRKKSTPSKQRKRKRRSKSSKIVN